VFVKSQEYLADGEGSETDAENDELNDGLMNDSTAKGQRTVDEDQLDE